MQVFVFWNSACVYMCACVFCIVSFAFFHTGGDRGGGGGGGRLRVASGCDEENIRRA